MSPRSSPYLLLEESRSADILLLASGLLSRVFERGEFQFRDLFNGPVPSFESNIAYTLRFMIDRKVRLLLRLLICPGEEGTRR